MEFTLANGDTISVEIPAGEGRLGVCGYRLVVTAPRFKHLVVLPMAGNAVHLTTDGALKAEAEARRMGR